MNLEKLETILGKKIISSGHTGGGCIADSYKIKLSNNSEYFVKSYGNNKKMLQAEAQGLKLLSECQDLKIPKVIDCRDEYLILEYIPPKSPGNNFFHLFGKQLASLHRIVNDQFGLDHDNYIGRTPQSNQYNKNWNTFFKNKRLGLQYQLLKKKGLTNSQFDDLYGNLLEKLPSLLGDHQPLPSLLHGDLWSGNFMVASEIKAALIDPACYFGDREADLAMTELFGGFPPDFYRGYKEIYPLAPGSEKRFILYNLYHIMNHLNLFGTSYQGQAISMMKSLIS